jgi:hypothetical protein
MKGAFFSKFSKNCVIGVVIKSRPIYPKKDIATITTTIPKPGIS